MNEIHPGYPSQLQTPLYWRDETSGKLESAVIAFFEPYASLTHASLTQKKLAPDLSAEQIKLLRDYLVYYIKAPCWKNNPHADSEEFAAIDRLTEQAQNISCRKDIEQFAQDCLQLGLDPF